MVSFPDGEKSLKICLAVSTEFRRVTDGRADRQTSCDGIVRAMHSIADRAVKIVYVQLVKSIRNAATCINKYLVTAIPSLSRLYCHTQNASMSVRGTHILFKHQGQD